MLQDVLWKHTLALFLPSLALDNAIKLSIFLFALRLGCRQHKSDHVLLLLPKFPPPTKLSTAGRPVRPGRGLQQDRPFLLHEGPGRLLPCQRPGFL